MSCAYFFLDLLVKTPLLGVYFSKLFGQPAYKTEEVASEGVKTSFFMCGPNKIELLEATNENSPIAKFLEKKGISIDVYGSDRFGYKNYKGKLPMYEKDEGLFPYKYTFNCENNSIKNYNNSIQR